MATSIRVLILQRVVPEYRVGVFKRISNTGKYFVKLIIGNSIPGQKAKNASDLSGIRMTMLPTVVIKLFGRELFWQKGLLSSLRNERPDVIVCEAESHFLGYVVAIFYKLIFSNNVKLILWCFYVLPGVERERSPLHKLIKNIARRKFDAFVSYSTYGKEYLVKKGVDPERIVVATNVCDTDKFLKIDSNYKINKEQAKANLEIDRQIVISFVGTLDHVKRPDVILEISRLLCPEKYRFFIIGDGAMLGYLKQEIEAKNIKNVVLTGRVQGDLPLYYRASDLIIVPGRGGIVISEAMCFGVPVIVHQADGVEYDLIKCGENGVIINDGTPFEFAKAIDSLSSSSKRLLTMGIAARKTVEEKRNTNQMALAVLWSIENVLRKE
jgi:glycosyltransferase involved in cell wall biosynthesis